jgi:hypothetical protein
MISVEKVRDDSHLVVWTRGVFAREGGSDATQWFGMLFL